MSRRPTISSARTSPAARIPTATHQIASRFPSVAARWSPSPVRNAIRTAAACEPMARKIETISDHLYGLRKPSRRANVCR
jgi:hypothetical protein